MEKLTIKELVLKSSIFEWEHFKDALKDWQQTTDNFELIHTLGDEPEIILLYKDKDNTYELYRAYADWTIDDSIFFDRFINDVDYMFDSYEVAELEYRESHI